MPPFMDFDLAGIPELLRNIFVRACFWDLYRADQALDQAGDSRNCFNVHRRDSKLYFES